MSFSPTDRLRRDMVVRDVRDRYPQTREVFERLRVHPPCWDCSLAEVAHRSGIRTEQLITALEDAIYKQAQANQEKSN